MEQAPTRPQIVVFRLKATLLQVHRAVQNLSGDLARHAPADQARFPYLLAESRSILWSDNSIVERSLQLGKVQNLRCALKLLQNIYVPADAIFSFWKQIGRANSREGYVEGRELREGCLIPSIGGGLCQLSNSLYDAALQAGCEIIERHPHSKIIPGSAASVGRDATVAWNYIDLRFRPRQDLVIEVKLTKEELIVRFLGKNTVQKSRPQESERVLTRSVLHAQAHSCHSCGIESCFRHRQELTESTKERTAYLVDECWPEYRSFVAEQLTDRDVLAVPIDGARWRLARYTWPRGKSVEFHTASFSTLLRSFNSRKLSAYGAKRVKAQLDAAGVLAQRLAAKIPYDAERICLSQSLLPFLWRNGFLGGRRFEVLMTRLPLNVLHQRLDFAAQENPERRTLTEFRAPAWLVESEMEALEAAERIITPHSEIASLFPDRTLRLGWEIPSANKDSKGNTIVFPGPTAARKGAYELRSAVRELSLKILLLGSELEGQEFWAHHRSDVSKDDWLNHGSVVIQPSLVEDAPRILLRALGARMPVVCTPACGISDLPGVTTVEYGDVLGLKNALMRVSS